MAHDSGSDTALFPWRQGEDAWGSTLDEPAVVGPVARRRPPVSADLGLLLARLVIGGVAVLAGARTLFGLPRGSGAGRAATEAVVSGYGFERFGLLTTVMGWAELVGGVLVVLGVFASLAASALLAVAVTAVGLTAPLALATQTTGPVERPLLAATLAAVIVLAGPGRVSADSGRSWSRSQTAVGLVGLLLGVGVGLTVLLALR